MLADIGHQEDHLMQSVHEISQQKGVGDNDKTVGGTDRRADFRLNGRGRAAERRRCVIAGAEDLHVLESQSRDCSEVQHTVPRTGPAPTAP